MSQISYYTFFLVLHFSCESVTLSALTVNITPLPLPKESNMSLSLIASDIADWHKFPKFHKEATNAKTSKYSLSAFVTFPPLL